MLTTQTITPTLVRRLVLTRQHLAGPCRPADAGGILDVVRDLGCLQLDPTSAVARSHLLVLWSRLGVYDPAHLDTLLWQDRRLFEYWAHAASLVLTEDYPIHHLAMRRFSAGEAPWSRRVGDWMESNAAFRDYILTELRQKGPLPARAFEDRAVVSWPSSGWTNNRNVSQMLNFLWSQGRIMVAGRKGGQKLWDLAEHWLPPDTPREVLDEHEVVRRAAQKAIRALGVASPADIVEHYTRGRYPGLASVLDKLEGVGRIVRVNVGDDDNAWPSPCYVYADDLPLLDRLVAGEWAPRTTLLSPFDNLICDRERTERLFGFRFRIEIYVPAAQRQYGYFVMPILHGDRLIGRVDPRYDRAKHRLTINAVFAEPDAPLTLETGEAIAGAIADLAAFLGAREIVYGEHAPDGWRSALN